MELLELYLLYFVAGIIQDFVATLNIRYINKDRTTLAAFTSFLSTVITFIVIYDILTRLGTDRSLAAILVYAVGIATGTIFAMKYKVTEQKKNRE
jgi:uncharacterized protein YebE (UPF0316 family)